MPKSLALGNGNILILFDKRGQVRDFYFPYVGQENQTGGSFVHRIGLFTDGKLVWFDDPSWDITVDCGKETLMSKINARNNSLEVSLEFKDVVYNEKNIFIRKARVYNLSKRKRLIRMFFAQQFLLYESHRGDTAYYDPIHKVIIHYKGKRVFLIDAMANASGFDDYTVGLFGLEGKEGSHVDAFDGALSKNPIEHGKVDSVIRLSFEIPPGESETMYYWVTTAKLIRDAHILHSHVLEKTPQYLMETAQDYWYAWVNKQNFSFYGLDLPVIELFKKSLFVLRAHVDNNGSILASGDSDMLEHGRDTYGYMWPRDGAFVATALDKAGDLNVAKRFFEFCNEVITDEGYLMHKYRPDKSLGSSWHPWIRDGQVSLPIQEDETALVIYALWKHYELSKDLEFIEEIYNSLIKKAADFMVSYIDEKTGLPQPSYDLWEEKFGTSTFTSSAVYAALNASSKFAGILGKTEAEEKYKKAASRMRDAIVRHLYNEKDGSFYKMILFKEGETIYDKTIDMSSIYGIFKFRVLDIDNERVIRAIEQTKQRLSCHTGINGIARYEGDQYYRIHGDVPGNPWFITTLWLVQYYIYKAGSEKELVVVKEWLAWVVKYALPSGILSEQLNPYTGQQVSAAPLTWSHSEFVITVIAYMEKLEHLGIAKVSHPFEF